MCRSRSSVGPEGSKDSKNLNVTGDRHCTNLFCLILFAFFWAMFLAVLIVGLSVGEKDRLWYANDYMGKLCGGSDRQGKKYVYYPRMSEDVLVYLKSQGTELTEGVDISVFSFSDINLYGLCVDKCPDMGDILCTDEFLKDNGKPSETQLAACMNTNPPDLCKSCWSVPLKTSSIFYRCMYETNITQLHKEECVYPDTTLSPSNPLCKSKKIIQSEEQLALAQAGPLVDQILYWKTRITGWCGDLVTVFPFIVLFGIVLSVVCGFLYIFLMKLTIKCFVYVIIFLAVAVSITFTVFCFYQAKYFTSSDLDSLFQSYGNIQTNVTSFVPEYLTTTGSNELYWEIGAWCMVFFDIVIFAIVCFCWSSIMKVVRIIEVTSDVLFKYPSLLTIPLLYLVEYAAVTIFFVFSSGLIFTLSKEELIDSSSFVGACQGVTNSNMCNSISDYTAVKQDDIGFYLLWFNLFGFFWTTQFFDAIYIMIIAGSVGQYYFTPRRNLKDATDSYTLTSGHPVLNSLKWTHRYHLGSCAFGSLIIAIVKIIRAIIVYIQKQLQGSDNRVVKCLLCCLSCCFWCLDKCLSYITKNAYIYTAIKGCGFIEGCKRSITAIMANMSLLGMEVFFVNAVQFLGKLLLATISGFSSYWYIFNEPDYQFGGVKELSNPFVPILVIVLISYIVAAIFMSVYGLIADTLVICLIEDNSVYKPPEESPYTPDNLKS